MWYTSHGQQALEAKLNDIFPQHNVHKNSRRDSAIKNSFSGSYLEVDVWVSDLQLCFEFQDYYHYKPAWYCQTPLVRVQHKDHIKRVNMINNHQTLIIVPCWWDGKLASLQETIRFQRPDLRLAHLGYDIPVNPPVGFFEEFQRLMQASFPESNLIEQSSWWAGEKWDGIRCFWDSTEKQLYSRNNFSIGMQPSVGNFGNLELDGEIWFGRGFFNESQGIITTPWEKFNIACARMVCFDEASLHAQQKPFEDRYSLILSHLPSDHPLALNAPRFLCESESVLQETLQCITRGGGEGIMLRKPLSLYLPGRSESLFKIKAANVDQEALVVRVEADGSLLLQLPHGGLFSVDKSDCQLPVHASKDDIVTFRVESPSQIWSYPHRKDTPSTPVVYRIRTDLSWDNVKRNYVPLGDQETAYKNLAFRDAPAIIESEETPNVRSWRQISERREFFEKFAASKGMDSLNPVFWYNTIPHDLLRYNAKYESIAHHYKGKLSTALMQLYPDIGLQRTFFKDLAVQSLEFVRTGASSESFEGSAKNRWMRLRDRRKFFENFALSHNMDSLNPIFWYNVTLRELKGTKGYEGIVHHYGGKLSSALMKIYPDIGLQQKQFRVNQKWKNERLRRNVFDKFAASKGMDPRNPLFWYDVTPRDLLQYTQEYKSISTNYGAKLCSTLMQLYPDIGLQESHFKVNNQSRKHSPPRRQFFNRFAASKGVDPLNPIFWYTVTPQELTEYDKGYETIASNYGGSLATMLVQVYPDIGLQLSHFKTQQSWKHQEARKDFFEKFAAAKGMNPLNAASWYRVTPRDLMRFDSRYKSISHYGGKLSTILSRLYPNIGIQQRHFKVPQHSWKSEHLRKEYFNDFAATQGMDPLIPDFWYTVTTNKLRRYNKAYDSISNHYGGKLSTTLMQLYPNIGLQSACFKVVG